MGCWVLRLWCVGWMVHNHHLRTLAPTTKLLTGKRCAVAGKPCMVGGWVGVGEGGGGGVTVMVSICIFNQHYPTKSKTIRVTTPQVQ